MSKMCDRHTLYYFLTVVLSESVPLVVSRNLVMNLSESVKSLSQQAQREILQLYVLGA
jgi:hypothetical protein